MYLLIRKIQKIVKTLSGENLARTKKESAYTRLTRIESSKIVNFFLQFFNL